MKYALEIAYKGIEFSGWQVQPNKPTVQEMLEKKIGYLYAGQKITVKSAGRTDAGVHALGMTATFEPPDSPLIDCNKLIKALNSILPRSIYIRKAKEVKSDFDARFSAVGKAYTYVICNSNSAGPFADKLCYHNTNFADLNNLEQTAQCFIGKHDFSSYASELNKTKKNPIRHIYRIEVNQFPGYICITFIGKSFLYKMVRSLMGTLIQAAETKISPEQVKHILKSKNRSKAHVTAPAHGLYLMKVFYDQENMNSFKLENVPFFTVF